MRTLLLLCLLWLASAPALALRPDELMVLVIGPSAQKIHPAEAEVVARLRAMRQRSGVSQLKMATMHFDRPAEASFARKVLGIEARDLTCLCLVQLDPRTSQPMRKLYSIPRVSGASMDSVEKMVATWAQTAGVTLGAMSNGSPSNSTWSPDPSKPRVRSDQTFSPEGILSTARQAENLSNQMWDVVRNQPLRNDRSDESCRQALLGVAEYTRLLRISLEEGRSNPRDRLQGVLRSRDNFRRSEPHYNLPVLVRPSYPQLDQVLDQIEAIYWQLNPQG